MSKFKTNSNKGFQMTFENGLTISVQWGTMNYCSRKSNDIADFENELKIKSVESSDAEIAIWDVDRDTWFDFGSDQVKGWCSTDEVGKWIHLVSTAKDLEDLKNISK